MQNTNTAHNAFNFSDIAHPAVAQVACPCQATQIWSCASFGTTSLTHSNSVPAPQSITKFQSTARQYLENNLLTLYVRTESLGITRDVVCACPYLMP